MICVTTHRIIEMICVTIYRIVEMICVTYRIVEMICVTYRIVEMVHANIEYNNRKCHVAMCAASKIQKLLKKPMILYCQRKQNKKHFM